MLTRETYEIPHGEVPEGLEQYPMPKPYGSQLAYGILALRFPGYFRKMESEFRPDLIHVHSLLYALISSFVDFRPKIVTVWGYHHLLHSWPLKRWLERKAIRSADIITVNSPRLKKAIAKTYGVAEERIKFLFRGIDLDLFKRDYEREVIGLKEAMDLEWADHLVLSPRAMTPHYNIDTILRSFANAARNKRIALMILRGTGSEQYEASIRELAEKLGIRAQVRFVDRFLSPREMAVMFNASDVFISIPTTDQVAFTLIEGMACGAFPLVADLPDYNGVIQNAVNGIRVSPRDELALAEAIKVCLSDDSLRRSAAARNRSFVEEFADMGKSSAQMKGLYESLVA